MLREEAQRHFEYWLTITFAFMAATFVGKTVLRPRISLLFGALYLLTVSLLISRYTVSGTDADRYMELAVQSGALPLTTSDYVTALRLAVFLFGTLLALWFLYRNTKEKGS